MSATGKGMGANAAGKGGVIHRLRRGLARLLSPAEEPPPARRTPRTSDQRTASAEAQFMSKLKVVLNQPREHGLLAGRVNFVAWTRSGRSLERRGSGSSSVPTARP
jgi:hypothetical protein